MCKLHGHLVFCEEESRESSSYGTYRWTLGTMHLAVSLRLRVLRRRACAVFNCRFKFDALINLYEGGRIWQKSIFTRQE